MLAVRQDGLVHDPDISKENAKDPVFLAYVSGPACTQLVPNLRAGETVIWDRLGRSWRALNPTKQRESNNDRCASKSGTDNAAFATDYNPWSKTSDRRGRMSFTLLAPEREAFQPDQSCLWQNHV
jgi:hypothetical protein